MDDWQFGLTDAARGPKPSLAAVARAYAGAGFPAAARRDWPRVTVAVCARNAADTLDACLRSIRALDYPDYDVMVVNDGSTDATGAIARTHPGVTVIDTPHGGLSAARNTALRAAAGEVIAYTDADVEVDPAWLTYLIQPFLRTDVGWRGRSERRAGGRSVDGAVRRARTGRTDPRAGRRTDRGTCPGLQHGVPA